MKGFAICKAFDGGDLRAVIHCGECKAGIYSMPICENSSRAALPAIAALLRSRESQSLPNSVKQRHLRLELQGMRLAVDVQRDGNGRGRLGPHSGRAIPVSGLCK